MFGASGLIGHLIAGTMNVGPSAGLALGHHEILGQEVHGVAKI
jgi:hypothetical protein